MPTTPLSAKHGTAKTDESNMLGIIFALIAVVIFASQDGISKYLAQRYDAVFVVMLRYWAFALFLIVLYARRRGGVIAVAQSKRLPLQVLRGVSLGLQVCLIVWCFANLGLLTTHAIFAVTPLVVVAMSVPFLGEKVGWHRAAAVVIGFCGVLIILRPGSDVFTPLALIPLIGIFMFAGYNILTRYVSRYDRPETSFFWTGMGGAIAVTCIGPFFWDPMQNLHDWLWMGVLAVMGASGHYFMIRALDRADASSIQPFFFLQTVLASLVGVVLFGEIAYPHMLIGAAVVIAAGMYAFWREAQRKKVPAP